MRRSRVLIPFAGAAGGRAARSLGWVLIVAAFSACQPAGSGVDLLAVPHPDLGPVEPLVRQQIEAGIADLERLRVDPDTQSERLAAAYGELGRLYHAYELSDAARACYRNAHQLAPREFEWTYYAAALVQSTGDLEAATQLFEQALVLRPGDLPARVRLGEVLANLTRDGEARAAWQRALEQDPECALAHYFLGRQDHAAGELTAAVAHFEAALALQPRASRLHYALAQAYRGLGDEERARSHLELFDGVGEVLLADPLMHRLDALKTGGAALVRRAGKAQLDGRPDVALAEYRKAVAADPGNLEARQGLGAMSARQGDVDGAVEQYATVVERDPNNALARFNLAGLLTRRGDLEAASGHYATVLGLDPGFRDARRLLAEVLLRQDDPQAAAAHYRELLAVESTDAATHHKLGVALAAAGDLEAALDAQRRVLELDAPPVQKARALGEIASISARQGRAEEALHHYRRALELAPELAEIEFGRANLLGTLGRYGEAAAAYRRVLTSKPDFAPARLGEVTALVLARHYGAARERLETALAADPSDLVLAHALARLLATSRRAEVRDGARAFELAQRVVAAEPTLEHAETVAMAMAEQGRFREAVAWQEKVLNQARGGAPQPLIRQLEQRLEQYRRDEPVRQ